MANPWFRLYAEIINDTKLLAVTEALRWRYVALLCLQCNGEYENTPDDEIAIALRISEQEWSETREIFIKRRLLNEDGSMRKWEERQYISDLKDPTAAERQKRYREKKRNERNGAVTSRLPESDTDTDTENKKNKYTPPIGSELLSAWMVVRKAKRAGSVTELVFNGVAREAALAGITTEQAIQMCCERGWGSFRAEYLKPPVQKTSQSRHTGFDQTDYRAGVNPDGSF